MAVFDGTAHQDNDPLPLVLVLSVLESELSKEQTRVSLKRQEGEEWDFATNLSDLDSRHEVRLAARLEAVQCGSDFAFVRRQRDQDFRSAEGEGGSSNVSHAHEIGKGVLLMGPA